MRLLITSILSLAILSSCLSIHKPSYVDLEPDISLSQSIKVGNGQRIKLSFSKVDSMGFFYSDKQLGYKMKENTFITKASSGIFSNNKLINVIDNNFTKWFKVNNFKVVKSRDFDKEVNVKLGYYSFQPVAYQPKIRFAIKITINDSKKRKIFSKWYFYEREYKDTLKKESNEKNINLSIKHLLEDIFRDNNFIHKLQ
ncbi:MAG: hypothetical protein HON23_00325 [Rickettsiales bacterium]|jgi:hypothetical protein|nr:hypothetical protein [Rickettsiales bacterium]